MFGAVWDLLAVQFKQIAFRALDTCFYAVRDFSNSKSIYKTMTQ